MVIDDVVDQSSWGKDIVNQRFKRFKNDAQREKNAHRGRHLLHYTLIYVIGYVSGGSSDVPKRREV